MSLLQAVSFRNQQKMEACKDPLTHIKDMDTGLLSVKKGYMSKFFLLTFF